MRTNLLLRSSLAVLFACALSSTGFADHDDHGDDHGAMCKHIDGPFTSNVVPVPPCTSPVGLCTHGILTGDLEATYDFTAQTLVPAGDPDHPNRFLYTGTSVITATHGNAQMFSNDHGYIDMNAPTDGSPFATTVVIASGTHRWKHTGGFIIASGELTLATGVAVGNYVGALCHEHHDDDDHDGDDR